MSNLTALTRFWAKVEKSEGCWNWQAATRTNGYGIFWFDGRLHPAHRWIYGQLVEPLVEGTHVDHLCRNRLCVRLDHLEQVSERVNILRGTAPAALNAAKTHCPAGHPYDEENTYIRRCGRRRCRTCQV